MPHRRKPEKGSFGGHFDELVKHFAEQQTPKSREGYSSKDGENVHDRLFERAWRNQPSRFSNQ